MKTLILAAGLGRRMKPLTDERHKSLLEVGTNETILGRILLSLSRRGLTDVVIVTGYRAGEVRDYAKGFLPAFDFTFVHNERYDETNNIHSMALAFEQVDFSDGLILIESDLVFDDSVLDTLESCPRENVALLDLYKPGMDGTVVRMDSDSKIVSVVPGSQQVEGFDFSGTLKTLNIYRFSGSFASSVFSPMVRFYAQAVDDNCYYELILGMLIAIGHAEVYGALVPAASWSEVDDPVDLQQARFLSSPNDGRSLLDKAWGGHWGLDITDFAFIRNMHFPTPQMVNELRLQLPELLSSYGSSQVILDRKMSWFLQVPEERVVAINGASQFFPWAATKFRDNKVFVQTPTFGEWNRSFPNAQSYPDGGDGLRQMSERLAGESVVVIVNPNNPTGTTVSTDEIFSLCCANPDKTFIVDESFIQFSNETSIIESLEKWRLDNVVVVQSLSKVLGVPGVRIGFVYSRNTALLGEFRASLPIWNMNSIAEKFVELLLKNRPALNRSFEQTKTDRQDLCQRLDLLPQVRSVSDSGADFVLVELDLDCTRSKIAADEMLSDHRIYVKEISHKFPGTNGHWRLAVRLPHEHESLVEAMAKVLSQVTGGARNGTDRIVAEC
jgi:histidinol-phosphate/aromatic aminotransferase/cobyric acid decarboxylase-like protein/choline kinase